MTGRIKLSASRARLFRNRVLIGCKTAAHRLLSARFVNWKLTAAG
jgi:hypothetical protein